MAAGGVKMRMRNERNLGSIRYLKVEPAGTQLDLGGMLVTGQPALQSAAFHFNSLPSRFRIVTGTYVL
jgi:hypothetical protein